MAIKSTIYKALILVSDIDRNYYAEHPVTLSCHPSETEERLMMRVLAFALNAGERLEFANAISDQDEPDLWEKDLTGEITLWIQVGQPDEKTLLKACGKARQVIVYCYNQKPRQWWEKTAPKLAKAKNLTVFLVEPESVAGLAALADRAMDIQFTVQDGEIYAHNAGSTVAVRIEKLARARQ